MEHISETLAQFHENVMPNGFDRVVLVLGDERTGKSTLMTQLVALWRDLQNRSTDPDSILDQLVWGDRQDFQRKLAQDQAESAIAVQDAATVLHKKQSMSGDQLDLQKTFLDMGYQRHLLFLGYQDYDDIATFLQKRRATNALVIPRRGIVRAHNRRNLDERYENDSWPDPSYRDTFPPLDGTELWRRYQERDHGQKEDRITVEEEQSAEDAEWQAKAKIAVALTEPWNDSTGMSYDDAGRKVGYSDSWVTKRVKEWRRGELEVDWINTTTQSPEGAKAD